MKPSKKIPGRIVEASAGLVFHAGRLLIAQRRFREKDELSGMWEFPGGKKELGESGEECLRRELREELAIEVTIQGLLETVEQQYSQKLVRIKFFRCAWIGGAPQALECHDFAWVTPEQLSKYEFPEADAQLLTRLQREPQLWS